MTEALLVYPHHLFEHHPGVADGRSVFLIEDPLFFSQYPFHKQKLFFHRATMRLFAHRLSEQGHHVHYVTCDQIEHSSDIAELLDKEGIEKAVVAELCDDWLEQRLKEGLKCANIFLQELPSPQFIIPREELKNFESGAQKRRFFMANFYSEQRKRLNVLMEGDEPVGGKWSFDVENRKKLPRKIEIPPRYKREKNDFCKEIAAGIEQQFPDNPGRINTQLYALTHEEARSALDLFLQERLHSYGAYQDAIDREDSFLFHSALSPYLNNGLLEPGAVTEAVQKAFHAHKELPLNSVEGFIRQIIGWREYVRLVYYQIGRKQRSSNFFGASRKIPDAFWDGSTGIDPIDDVIQRTLETGYANHIERLMVLANFMQLCGFCPDEVYRWFMSLFIDAYDWVMVPNVYGMALYADGGKIVTKPYVSSSNYIRKMSWYKKESWSETWDGLYWNFIHSHHDVFASNPRMKMMISHIKRMENEKLNAHLQRADEFLSKLSE